MPICAAVSWHLLHLFSAPEMEKVRFGVASKLPHTIWSKEACVSVVQGKQQRAGLYVGRTHQLASRSRPAPRFSITAAREIPLVEGMSPKKGVGSPKASAGVGAFKRLSEIPGVLEEGKIFFFYRHNPFPSSSSLTAP